MFEAAGDLGFEQETRTGFLAAEVLLLDLLERDLAVQLLVEGDRHLAETAGGVRTQDDEAAGGDFRAGDGGEGIVRAGSISDRSIGW